MSAETAAKAMIQKRIADGKSWDAAYDDVISTIDAGVKELESQAAALRKKLEVGDEPAEYIKRRLDPFAIQVELQMFLLQAVRQLKQSGWKP